MNIYFKSQVKISFSFHSYVALTRAVYSGPVSVTYLLKRSHHRLCSLWISHRICIACCFVKFRTCGISKQSGIFSHLLGNTVGTSGWSPGPFESISLIFLQVISIHIRIKSFSYSLGFIQDV